MKLARLAILLPIFTAAAQTFDTSGNGMLNGTYYFRDVIYYLGDQSGDLGQATALYGTLSFNGAGTFTLTAVTAFDSNAGQVLLPSTTTGTYSISASGLGFINVPVVGTTVRGLVSQAGIFVGSATEVGVNDLFIAAPLASPLPTNASFKGSYSIAAFDLSSGSPTYATNYQYQLNPDGAGNLGTVSITGYFGGGGSTVYTQTLSGQKYSFTNTGGCNLAFPTTNASNAYFINSGQKFLYISPDGNFVFGGSPGSWDMFVGVRNSTTTPSFGGLYYEAGFDEYEGLLDSYYGSLNAGGGLIIDHQRTLSLLSVFYNVAYGATYSDSYSVKSNGTYTNGLMNYVVGAGGAVRIGSGIGPSLGINVALAAPSFSGSGVYLFPTGVLNAGSGAPFTSGIAPGELLTLYGTNLAPTGLQVAPGVPLPTTLGGVQVTLSGLPAPIYYISPTQISVIVPYAVTGATAQVQVNNNGTPSNTVTTFVNKTAPGVFTQDGTGLGYGSVTHQDGITLVTPLSPAKIGETVIAYLTGLGAVNPLVQDGAAGGASQTTNMIGVDISGVTATVAYAGLAPGSPGEYQINFTVPTGLTAGDNTLDIQGPDSYAAQTLISVSTSSTAFAPEFVTAPFTVPHRFPKAPEIRQAPHYEAPFQLMPRRTGFLWPSPVTRPRPTNPKSR